MKTKSTKELIDIAQQIIDFAAHPGNTTYIYSHQLQVFNSTRALYDRLTGRKSRVTGEYWQASGQYSTSYDLLGGIDGVHSYYTHKWYNHISTSISKWSMITGHNSHSGALVNLPQGPTDTSTLVVLDVWSNTYTISKNLLGESGPSSAVCYYLGNSFVIDSIQTVLFMTLSSYLAECSGEAKYKEAATAAANFLRTWALDPETSLIKDRRIYSFNAQDVDGAALSCHLTGLAIEGFVVLASVTGNSEWSDFAIEISIAAMRYEGWHSSDGILVVGADGDPSENTPIKTMKGFLNRGLMIAYQRNRSNKPFCDLVRSYINVQFNALHDLSRMLTTYGVDWRGPYVGPYAHAQIAAFDTLVAAIAVNDEK
ncbi:hypothetical protein FRC03_004848 [Tulasnella sp. 419]|nr:hypothetical protein FRC03_004848 [Tulasnella sp. 419]